MDTRNDLSFDDHPSGPEEALWSDLLDAVLLAAGRGWTPTDLLHVLGAPVAGHLVPARACLPETTQTRVRQIWDRWSPDVPATGTVPFRTLLQTLAALHRLPVLADTSLLTDLAELHRRDLWGSPPSAEQEGRRRARQRVSGLLAKAASTSFPAEAETLVAKAQQLRQRYRIEDTAADPDPVGEVVSLRVHLHAPWVSLQYLLLSVVAGASSCRTVLQGDLPIVCVLGHPDDVRHTAELFDSLNRQRRHFMLTAPGAAEARRSRTTSAYRRAFLRSYAHRIGELLTQASDAVPVTPEEASRALPVLARRDEAATATLHEVFPRTRSLRLSHSHHIAGSTDGVRAAERSRLTPAEELPGCA